MIRRVLTLTAIVLATVATVGCGDDSTSTVTPSGGGAFAGTAAAAIATAPASGSVPTAVPPTTPAAVTTPPGEVPDGTYSFTLSNGGFSAELLLAVRANTLVLSQMTVSNHTGSGVNAVPRLHFIDSLNHTFDAQTEGDWRRLYPEGGVGLLDGKSAQIRVGFTQPFDPTDVTFCLNLGPQDLGCFARSGGRTPIPTQ